jgi:hypothetical protein
LNVEWLNSISPEGPIESTRGRIFITPYNFRETKFIFASHPLWTNSGLDYSGRKGPQVITRMESSDECVPIRMTVGPVVKTKEKGPTKCYHEVLFRDLQGRRIKKIQFRNFYCASLVIKQQQMCGDKLRWRTILEEKKLMADPHYEDDAQAWHSILESEFTAAYDPDGTKPFRFYLFQPSPHWRRYELRELACYALQTTPQNAPSPTQLNSDALLKSSLFGQGDRNMRNIVLLQQRSQEIVDTINTFESSETISNNPVSALAFDHGPMVHVSIRHNSDSTQKLTARRS